MVVMMARPPLASARRDSTRRSAVVESRPLQYPRIQGLICDAAVSDMGLLHVHEKVQDLVLIPLFNGSPAHTPMEEGIALLGVDIISNYALHTSHFNAHIVRMFRSSFTTRLFPLSAAHIWRPHTGARYSSQDTSGRDCTELWGTPAAHLVGSSSKIRLGLMRSS